MTVQAPAPAAPAPAVDPARRRLVVAGGAALVASAVLSLAGGLTHPVVDGNAHSVDSLLAPASPWAQLSIYAGALALMAGLPAAWAWFAPRVGVLGTVGFGLYFLGNALSAQGHLVVEGLVAPAIARSAPELVPTTAASSQPPVSRCCRWSAGWCSWPGWR